MRFGHLTLCWWKPVPRWVCMSRITAIICGLLLFGLGLFLGMVGSFVHTLSPETPRVPKMEVRVTPVVSQSPRMARPKQSKVTQPPPPAVESALSQALAMVAVALASQPATAAPPAAVTPADTATNAPEQHPLELLMGDTAGETAKTEPPPAAATPPSPLNPFEGHWVLDQRLGWLWLPENSPSVVVVPMIEVFPGGLITIHAGPKSTTSKTLRKSAVTPQPPQLRKDSVIQHDAPGSKQSSVVLPFPRKQ